MSYNFDVLDLKRGGETSITQQLTDHIAGLIDGGELEPGAKLPATRALAADAGINHLTAVRVYRRLAELGYVTAAVGRGTFVRRNVPSSPATAALRENDDWQLGMLAPRTLSHADEMLRDSLHAPHSADAIALGSGFPDPQLCPSQELADIAAQLARDEPHAVTGYLEVEGLPELRERLAELGREAGYATSPDEILVTSGARQGIDLIARAVLSPGDVAVVESPTFAGILASLQATGARVLPLPVDAEGPDIAALERILARHEIKLVALQSSCANPTGADLAPARRERLLELARTRGFFVLDDGVYATMRYDGAPLPRLRAAAPSRRERLLELARTRGFFVLDDGVYATMRYDGAPLPRLRAAAPSHVIYVDSLSKTIGGGLRVGWIAASGPVFARLVQLKLDSDIHTSALPQHLGARYLRGDRHERLLQRAIPVYRRRRDALLRALERHLSNDATWTIPSGGHNTWVTLDEPVDERALYAEALRAGVSFLPGGAICAEKPSRTSMRLSFGLVEPELHDEAVRRLAVALREVRRRGRASATGALS
jgi:DNA-binding transcriptional MocR family regulator